MNSGTNDIVGKKYGKINEGSRKNSFRMAKKHTTNINYMKIFKVAFFYFLCNFITHTTLWKIESKNEQEKIIGKRKSEQKKYLAISRNF